MQNRYVGDVGDFGKYGLLRGLAASGLRLGVVWYLNAAEEANSDGSVTEYSRLRPCDAELFDCLAQVRATTPRGVAQVAQAKLLPADTLWFEEPVPTVGRQGWHQAALAHTADADLVFADPDNGLAVAAAGRASAKYAALDEIRQYAVRGQSVLVYHHASRQGSHVEQITHWCRRLSAAAPGAEVSAYYWHRLSCRFYFLLAQPAHRAALKAATNALLHSEWCYGPKPHFTWHPTPGDEAQDRPATRPTPRPRSNPVSHEPTADQGTRENPRTLEITDLERIERFRHAGYGGCVSDALCSLGVTDSVFAADFRPLRQGMQLVGRALPIKLHSLIEPRTPEHNAELEKQWEAAGGHPQKRMMRAVADAEDGCILCFDCGGDMQPAHFGEMSCQLAYAHGCRGMLLAGNCRDTQYVLKMADFPLYSFGTRPNAFGGWIITEVNNPIYLPGHLTHYVRVNPGDFIFGDNDGVQLIPAKLVDEVLLRVEATFAKENEEREQIAGGMPIDEVYRVFGVL